MTDDSNWDALVRKWQSAAPTALDAQDISRKVRARTRGLGLAFVGEIAATVIMIGGASLMLTRSQSTFTWSLLGSLLVLFATAHVLAWRMRRGTWHAREETVQAHIQLSIARAARDLQTIGLAWKIYWADLVIVVALHWIAGQRSLVGWVTVSVTLVIVGLALRVWSVRSGRRTQVELAALERLRAAYQAAES